ncbi:relaxase/mobilization nuclease domain-containing protein [Streptantibioticus ferralitis]|uniref:relaxase/mobilization nuclease domain-containing protein n=1 Tax=Streptantibioticus ferralitis TaxID=236510 RepID=UPI00355845E9
MFADHFSSMRAMRQYRRANSQVTRKRLARRVVAATGIAPDGDDQACRWIAVRHADDHIHIVATTVRADGRRPRTNRDGWRAQKECRKIEEEFGLRRSKSGDLTAPKTLTSAEQAKAQRRGKSVTSREWLRDEAYAVLAVVRTEEEFFSVLDSLGIQAKKRIDPETGDVIGYSLAAPGDTNAQGESIWLGGSKLASDLSIHRIRERLDAQKSDDVPAAGIRPVSPWHQAETALRQASAVLDSGDDAAAQAQLAAFAELLHNTAKTGPPGNRAELRAAAAAFNRANRSAIRADHQQAAALRGAARELCTAIGPGQDGAAFIALLSSAVLLAIAAARWHEKRGHQQQAAAARRAAEHLSSGYRQAAAPVLADLAQRAPRAEVARRFEADLRRAVPEQADRILADPAWPALTTTLARAESSGHRVGEVLAEAAEQRELDTAHSLAEVLNWRISAMPNKRASAATARSRSLGGTAYRPSSTAMTELPPHVEVARRTNSR